jgi:hypothetical protein
MVFANARINKQHHNPASHHECKNTPTSLRSVRGTARHRDAAATAHTAGLAASLSHPEKCLHKK